MCKTGYKHTPETRARMSVSRGGGDRAELAAAGMQRCGTCRAALPFAAFYTNRSMPSGLTARCRECIKKGPRYGSSRTIFEARLRRDYGITVEIWARAFNSQNGACKPLIDDGQNGLHTDHCHATGRFRGLLCGMCNTAAGSLRDDPAVAEALARYLRSP